MVLDTEDVCSVAKMNIETKSADYMYQCKKGLPKDNPNMEKDKPVTDIHGANITDIDCLKDTKNTSNILNTAEYHNHSFSSDSENHLCKTNVDINAVHKPVPKQEYCCGCCASSFSTICFLHEHLLASHQSGGSYHYNHYLKTAFPKFDTCCRFTQTGESVTEKEPYIIPLVDKSELDNMSHIDKANIFTQESEKENTFKYQNTSKLTGAVETRSSKSITELAEGTDDLNTWKNVKIENIVSIEDLNYSSDGADNYFDDGDEAEESAMVTKYLKETENLTDKIGNDNDSPGKRRNVDETKPRKRKQSKPKNIKAENDGTETLGSKPVSRKNMVKLPRGEMPTSKPLYDPIPDANCKCDLCGAKFSFKRGLLRHEQMKHLNKMKHECQYCNQKFMREYNLQKHIKCVHTVGRGQKYKEKYRAKRKLEKVEMENVTVEESPAQPVAKPEKENTDLEEETCKKKEENLSPKAPHTCNLCGYTMPRSKMEVHQRLHTGERPYICHVCGKGLISQNKLKRHMLIHSEIKKHTCDVCGAGFQMKYKLRMHQHIHTGKKPYLCSTCGAEFNHSSNLATHTRCVHLQIKPFVCPTCGSRYAKRSQLDDHILSHSTEKQFTCRYCGKSFKYYKGMRRHEKNHFEEKNFKCDKCDCKFTREDNLERHIAASHAETPFECKTCKKTFKNEKLLQEHMYSHTKSKQYQCVLCGEKYKVVNQYYTHMLAAHGIDREQAKLIQGEEKQTSVTVMQTLNPSVQIDPNLPLRLDAEPAAVAAKTGTENVTSIQNVPQMVSGIVEDNRAVINALTRVATENLRLHSEDVNDEEKLNVIVPPLNPMILLERSQGFTSLTGGNSINVSEGNSHNQASLGMLVPVSQSSLQQNVQLVNENMQLPQHRTIRNQVDHNLRLPQEGRSTNFSSLKISLPQESRSISQGNLNSAYSIQEARMTLENLARQHEAVSVPLTLMRLSENMMDPPVERQNHETREQTTVAGNVAYRIQNPY